MNWKLSRLLLLVFLLTFSVSAVKVGESAPDFQATDSNGQVHKLAQYRGKFVVLEWHNNGCPYTRKHYESGNMQRLQREWIGKGVVWFSMISSAPGQQGYVTAQQENDYLKKMKASPSAVLLDPEGNVGRLYSAKTTPHMFIINPEGVLLYDGAIDDKATTDRADIATAKNYVSQALEEAMANKPVSIPTTRPYGCSVKYAH
jgi:thioredoxin-related protein